MLNNPHKNEDLNAPAKLAAALRELERSQEPIFIPRTADEAISRAAHQHLGQARKSRVAWLWWKLSLTGAGVVAMVALMAQFVTPSPERAPLVRLAKDDVNHDGKVDVLDAFALARQLKSGTAHNSVFDINGDGIVDEQDAAEIAAHAVKLEKGGRS